MALSFQPEAHRLIVIVYSTIPLRTTPEITPPPRVTERASELI